MLKGLIQLNQVPSAICTISGGGLVVHPGNRHLGINKGREYLMLHTTFKLAHESGACTEGYRKLAKHLGGVDKYGKDTPIPLSKIVESNGLLDAIWSLRCTTEPSKNIQIEFACRCAEHVLHFYEDKYPDDKRPREAIEAARAYAEGRGSAAEAAEAAWDAWEAAARAAWAAEDAARAAARAAAWAAWAAEAARDVARAAWDAARAAEAAARAAAWAAESDADARAAAEADEQEWQKQTFLGLLNQKYLR
jgi:hypothetical protein